MRVEHIPIEKKKANTCFVFFWRQVDTGERVGIDIYGDKLEKEYGAPYYQVHVSFPNPHTKKKVVYTIDMSPQRADIHQILHDLAKPYMILRLRSRVVRVSPDPPSPHVVLASGEIVYGDMIIGADGVKSAIRTCMAHGPGPDAPTPTGDSAYRATISTQGMLNDPELKHFVDGAESTFWMGPGMHVVGYCLVRICCWWCVVVIVVLNQAGWGIAGEEGV